MTHEPDLPATSTPPPPLRANEDALTTAELARPSTPTNVEAAHTPTNGVAGEDTSATLLSQQEAKDLRTRWDALQTSFVDEPRRAVEQADNLVANAMKRLAEVFAEERGKLEGQWDRGDDVSTEDLRLALHRYRAFFGRLLAV
ncbi:MAG TPA: hypothetical protein VIJ59_05510 [Caulobacteraceae bacterium]